MFMGMLQVISAGRKYGSSKDGLAHPRILPRLPPAVGSTPVPGRSCLYPVPLHYPCNAPAEPTPDLS